MFQYLKKHKLAFATTVYWFLLLYIISALVWWFIALQQQNEQMATYKKLLLDPDDKYFEQKIDIIERMQKRKTSQYFGEGATFLLLILTGAVFVYRSVKKEIKLSEQQKNFMMAVTHELKTPITIAHMNLESLQKYSLDETRRQQLISLSLEETTRLNNLTNNILTASQLESGVYNMKMQPVNFSKLVNEVCTDLQKRFPSRNIFASLDEDIFVVGENALLQLVLNNLINNAIKYSPKEKNIHVTIKAKDGQAVLEIIDEGVGINDEEKKKVFDKFYRVGNEETRTAKGTGLGLYLCKKIIQDHKGKVKITDNKPQGAIFTVILDAI